MTKSKKIKVHGTEILVYAEKGGEFIGLWELFNNPNFNSIEFDGIKNLAGSNSFAQGRKLLK